MQIISRSKSVLNFQASVDHFCFNTGFIGCSLKATVLGQSLMLRWDAANSEKTCFKYTGIYMYYKYILYIYVYYIFIFNQLSVWSYLHICTYVYFHEHFPSISNIWLCNSWISFQIKRQILGEAFEEALFSESSFAKKKKLIFLLPVYFS